MTLIEKVARTLVTSYGLDWETMMDGSLGVGADHLCRGFWHCMAKDAIEAMREPTEAMVAVGVGHFYDTDDKEVEIGWNAMIDAALNEKAG